MIDHHQKLPSLRGEVAENHVKSLPELLFGDLVFLLQFGFPGKSLGLGSFVLLYTHSA